MAGPRMVARVVVSSGCTYRSVISTTPPTPRTGSMMLVMLPEMDSSSPSTAATPTAPSPNVRSASSCVRWVGLNASRARTVRNVYSSSAPTVTTTNASSPSTRPLPVMAGR